MKINIFGVGRSGTKAIQLYTTYLLSQKSINIKLNYEPYFWNGRKGIPNLVGLKHHLNTPLFTQATKPFHKNHVNFLNKIIPSKTPVVTKFIRANGRIDAINKISEPDITIIIIRDLYEVLSSISNTNWDFYSHGSFFFNQLYFNDWNRVLEEAVSNNITTNQIIKFSNTCQASKNAFYWYIMNIKALQSQSSNTYFINYANIHKVEHLLKTVMNIDTNLKISDRIFKGKNIMSDDLLKNIDNESILIEEIKYKFNQLLLFLSSKKSLPYLPLFPQKSGNLVTKNSVLMGHISDSFNIKTKIQQCNFLDDLNSEVFSLLEKLEYRY